MLADSQNLHWMPLPRHVSFWEMNLALLNCSLEKWSTEGFRKAWCHQEMAQPSWLIDLRRFLILPRSFADVEIDAIFKSLFQNFWTLHLHFQPLVRRDPDDMNSMRPWKSIWTLKNKRTESTILNATDWENLSEVISVHLRMLSGSLWRHWKRLEERQRLNISLHYWILFRVIVQLMKELHCHMQDVLRGPDTSFNVHYLRFLKAIIGSNISSLNRSLVEKKHYGWEPWETLVFFNYFQAW